MNPLTPVVFALGILVAAETAWIVIQQVVLDYQVKRADFADWSWHLWKRRAIQLGWPADAGELVTVGDLMRKHATSAKQRPA